MQTTNHEKKNYLSNASLLQEIHLSKNSFSSFVSTEYSDYDIIINAGDTIDTQNEYTISDDIIEAGVAKRAARLGVPASEVSPDQVVFRVMTYGHIPLDPSRKRKPKRLSEFYTKLNFRPFIHVVLTNGKPTVVGKSHWHGDIDSGHFSMKHGKITDKLAVMYITLSERYANHRWYRWFSYRDEMSNEALVLLVQNGLFFNEASSSNPFSYLTTVVSNEFKKIKEKEKEQQAIRDELLIDNNLNPSYTRQYNEEFETELARFTKETTDHDEFF